MQIKLKRGMLAKNFVELVLSVAAVFVLLVLMFNLFAPSFDRGEKTAESYFDNLEMAIEDADDGGEGSFIMQDYGDEDSEFYLVYFGGIASFKDDGENFVRSKQGENVVCICYWEGGDVVCNYCEDLKNSVRGGEGGDYWIIKEGERVMIKKIGEIYEFSKV